MKKRKSTRTRAGHAHKRTTATRYIATREERRPIRFAAMETGQPDRDPGEGRGPLSQEGEGERQNSQLAELEGITPEEAPPHRRR